MNFHQEFFLLFKYKVISLEAFQGSHQSVWFQKQN